MHLLCKQNKYEFCSTLAIGAGEAFLTTPPSFLVKGKIKELAKLIANGKIGHLSVTLPLSKQSFVKALQNTGLNMVKNLDAAKNKWHL